MTPSERLAALGLTLPPVPAPVAAYVPFVVHDGVVWTSGQLPFSQGALAVTGKVGDAVGIADATEAARTAALNALAALAEAAGGLDKVRRILKMTVYVASTPDFTGHPAIANGASELLEAIFGQAGRHARVALGVSALPLDAPVEVEVIAAL